MKERHALRLLVTLLLVGVLWVLLVGSLSWHELIVGVFGTLLTVTFMAVTYTQQRHHLAFRLRDLLQLRRVPGELLRGVALLLRVLVQDVSGQRSPDLFRFCGIQTAKDDPELAARRVLVTVYGSIAPDTIVLGVDYAQSRLLLHQVRPVPVSETLRRLGAQS